MATTTTTYASPAVQMDTLSVLEPNLLFYITRSKNANVVIYAANMAPSTATNTIPALHASTPLNIYWLDLDPAYVAAARRDGRKSDRSELNVIERTMAYGADTRPSSADGRQHQVKLKACPQRTLTLYVDAKSGQARVLIQVQNESARLLHIHVDSTDRGLLPPKVNHVDFYARSLKTGALLHERMLS